MENIPLVIVILMLAFTVLSWAVSNNGYSQSPPAQSPLPIAGLCPSGQAPVLNGTGQPVIDNQTHSVKCIPIDASGNFLGQ
jgi:hypothetical protein